MKIKELYEEHSKLREKIIEEFKKINFEAKDEYGNDAIYFEKIRFAGEDENRYNTYDRFDYVYKIKDGCIYYSQYDDYGYDTVEDLSTDEMLTLIKKYTESIKK